MGKRTDSVQDDPSFEQTGFEPIYVSFLFLVSVALVLSNAALPELIEINSGKDYFLPYYDFTQALFGYNSSYLSESIFLPILSRVLGAHHSTIQFVLLNLMLYCLIIPVVGWMAQRKLRSYMKGFLFVSLLMCALRYLHHFDVGMPDPITLLFLAMLPMLPCRATKALIGCSLVAGLSHFSLACVATSVWLIFVFLLKGTEEARKKALPVLIGLLISKLFISLWMLFWGYKVTEGRLMWVINHGWEYFFTRYVADTYSFWMTPGVGFFVVVLLLVGLNLYLRRYRFVIAAFTAISLVYGVHFFTIDGLRIFSVAVCSVLIEMLMTSLLSLRLRVRLIL